MARAAVASEARELGRALQSYRGARTARSLVELVVTVVPLVASATALALALEFGIWWLYGILILPTAAFLVRLFMIQHDCGHGAFFTRRRTNDWTGRILGIFTLTPYDHWRQTHAEHHAGAGNLARRGVGDVLTLTVDEYAAAPWWQRFGYRLYRHPVVLFLLGPVYLFHIQNRYPGGMWRTGWTPWLGTMATNVLLGALLAGMILAFGWQALVLIYLPVTALAAAVGVWLFFVQHQFEETRWEPDPRWDAYEAALHGSSYYDLPPVLRWLTANIGIHHVHHLCARIPFYRLPRVLREHPVLQRTGRVSLRRSLSLMRLALWDPQSRRLISFGEWRRRAAAVRPALVAAGA